MTTIAWLVVGPRWNRVEPARTSAAVTLWVAVALFVVLALPLLFALDRLLGLEIAALRPVARSVWSVAGGALVLTAGLGWMLHVGRYLAVHLYRLEPDARPLLTAGPFARTRHPFFFHFVLVPLGFALVVANPLLLALWLFYPELQGPKLLTTQMREEEEAMRARFGASYDAYAAHTPRLVPRMRRRAQR